MSRRYTARAFITLVSAAVLLVFVSIVAGDAKTTTIVVRTPGAATARNVPITFGLRQAISRKEKAM
jgi:hypothetical protein